MQKNPTFLPISSGCFSIYGTTNTTFTGSISAQQIYSKVEKQVNIVYFFFFILECDKLDVEVYNP